MRARMSTWVHALLLAVASTVPVFATEPFVIAVPGSATKTVATDELGMTFDLSTEGISFSNAKSEADAVVKRIQAGLGADYADRARVESQVVVMKQKKISWSSKAKRLDHRVMVTIGGLEADLPTQAVKVLDRLLALDPRLELTDARGQLSDSRSSQVRAELLAAAVQDAHGRADSLAREAGHRVGEPRRISAAPRYSMSSDRMMESIVVSSRSFDISTDLMGVVDMSVEIVAEYLAPPL